MTIKKFINNFEEYLVVWGIVVMTLVTFLQVVMRYVFRNSLTWSEELARYLFLWVSWLGASYAVKEREHFRVTIIANKFKGKARKTYELVILLIWFVFSACLAYWGMQMVGFLTRTGQTSPAIGMPMTIPYLSVPIGCVFMCVRLIIEITKLIKGEYVPGSENPSEIEAKEIMLEMEAEKAKEAK